MSVRIIVSRCFLRAASQAHYRGNEVLSKYFVQWNPMLALGLKQANACLSDSDFGSAAANEPARLA